MVHALSYDVERPSMKAFILPALLTVLLSSGCSSEPSPSADVEAALSPYVGEEQREIKALSAEDVSGLLAGEGMGFAKAAELNHYPGPRHVLDDTRELGLAPEQQREAERIFREMKEETVRLGGVVVKKERELDRLFASQRAAAEQVRSLTREIGALTGELRYAHLQAHLQLKGVLTPEQVRRYDELRGYGGEGHLQHRGH